MDIRSGKVWIQRDQTEVEDRLFELRLQGDGSRLAQGLGWSECRTQALSRKAAIEHLQTTLENQFSHAEVLYYSMRQQSIF